MNDFEYENHVKLLPEGEVILHDPADVCKLIEMLVRNDYIVMISREDDLWVVNYTWEQYCNRNDVVFQDRDYFESHFVERRNESL